MCEGFSNSQFQRKKTIHSNYKPTHLVFISIAELCIHHMYVAAFVRSHVEAQLLLPGPGIRTGNVCLLKLLHDTDVVDDIQD